MPKRPATTNLRSVSTRLASKESRRTLRFAGSDRPALPATAIRRGTSVAGTAGLSQPEGRADARGARLQLPEPSRGAGQSCGEPF